MGLFSFLKGHDHSGPERTEASTGNPVQTARARARRRLIGAAVLLGVGVIGFPILFESQPRPIPVDIPIEIPRKDAAPSLPLPPPRMASAAAATAARVSSGVITQNKADEAQRTPPPTAAAPAVALAAKPEASAKPAPAPKADDGARARALLDGAPMASKGAEGKPAESKVAQAQVAPAQPAAASPADEANKSDSAAARFVVQVGAYSASSSARDMRQRVEKLGLKAYTQEVEVGGAKRIRVRVGPFNARNDAEKAADSLKAAGLPAAVLTL